MYDQAKWHPYDNMRSDAFGVAIAVSADLAIIGAYGNEDFGPQSGSAYLFEIPSGLQRAKLLSPNGDPYDYFGLDVGIDGQYAIVGANGDDTHGSEAGAAYLFDTSTGALLYDLVPQDIAAGDKVGPVGIDGTIAVVGAYEHSIDLEKVGAAYLFRAETGEQTHKLVASDGQAVDHFGGDVALHGNVVIVGAPSDDDNGPQSGSAYLFDAATGAQTAKLLAADGTGDDLFGMTVDTNGVVAVIGAEGHDRGGQSYFNFGAAYLFDVATAAQVAKLAPSDGDRAERFGGSVAIDGNRAVIGSVYDGDNGPNSGSAYLWDVTTVEPIGKFLATDGRPGVLFGGEVAIRGDAVVIGATEDYDNGSKAGAAYYYDLALVGTGMRLDISPLVAGRDGRFIVTGARPNKTAWLAYSLIGPGSTYVPTLDVTLNLATPQQAAPPRAADANGDVEWLLPIPTRARSQRGWFQACQRRAVSNSWLSVVR